MKELEPVSPAEQERRNARVTEALPFIRALVARAIVRMPRSVEYDDLLQNAIIGAMDAANRFDPARGIKFETFAERRMRGAMIDALRRDAWPRGIRKFRRELEKAREVLRVRLGEEPGPADLAEYLGKSESDLKRFLVRLHTIEATGSLTDAGLIDPGTLPPVLVPAEPPSPEALCASKQLADHVRLAMSKLPSREARLIELYYFEEQTMKEIGDIIGVNESRVSQLHARALNRIQKFLPGSASAAR